MLRRVKIGAVLAAAGLATVAALPAVGQMASAQAATGSVTGQVVWSTPYLRCVFPYAPVAPGAPQTGAPADSGGSAVPAPATGAQALPQSVRAIPAGAVLVAVQGTGVSTRTDENGRFMLAGVPAGQFLTVAAGPVSAAGNAWALQPNVQVSAGQTVDLGQLSLGASTGVVSPICPAVGAPVPDATTGGAPTSPPDAVPAPSPDSSAGSQ